MKKDYKIKVINIKKLITYLKKNGTSKKNK